MVVYHAKARFTGSELCKEIFDTRRSVDRFHPRPAVNDGSNCDIGRQNLSYQRDILDKLSDISVRRIAQNVSRFSELDYLTLAHDRDPVGEAKRFLDVMGYKGDRLVELLLKPQKLGLHLAADQRVQRRKRLVEDQSAGPTASERAIPTLCC